MTLQRTLTERERQVLRLYANGHSVKEIARKLNVSIGTVKNHTKAILRCLGARNRTEAVAIGMPLLGE